MVWPVSSRLPSLIAAAANCMSGKSPKPRLHHFLSPHVPWYVVMSHSYMRRFKPHDAQAPTALRQIRQKLHTHLHIIPVCNEQLSVT